MRVNKITPSLLSNKSILKPRNLSKIPDVLIYSKSPNERVMIDTKRSVIVGRMYIELRRTFAYIGELYINFAERNKGYGKKFLDYAQNYSRINGRKGNLRLLAGAMGVESKSPHAFYRKYGFTSYDTKRIAEIDSYIKNNQELPQLYPSMNLYYEPAK